MKAFAKMTAVIFLILGIVVVLIGISIMVSGFTAQKPVAPSFTGLPDVSGLMLLAKMIAGGAVSLQGLFLSAIGQGLWLVTAITDNTEKTSQYLSMILRKNNQQPEIKA
jgi:hypothetical protein